MCLAYLFKKAQQDNLCPPLDLHAFIVDHRARHGSTEEAQTVSRHLERIGKASRRTSRWPIADATRSGIQSKIISMRWPEETKPLSLPNFETRARLQRYHLLCQESRRLGIQHLFLGHHQDDLIETIIMRLVRSEGGSLACFEGIAACSRIPVGDEIMADQAGPQISRLAFYVPWMVETEVIRGSCGKKPSPQAAALSANTLKGRIALADKLCLHLHRPLLKFSKARILSTCAANSIPYVSDPTNFDPHVTLRNAVRHMVSNHKLPRALSKHGLLDAHLQAQRRLSDREQETQMYFGVSPTTAIDLRSGSLTVRLPRFPQVLQWEDPQTAARFLGRFLRVVSPGDSATLFMKSSQEAVELLFPSLQGLSASVPARKPASVLTTCKVMLTREDSFSKQNPLEDYYTTWRFSRQPFHRTELCSAVKRFVAPHKSEVSVSSNLWSDWLLWDNRYWIRLCGSTEEYLLNCIVRPFERSDCTALRQALAKHSKELLQSFDALLSDAAPGEERYTLPVIVDNQGIRVFPTLDFSIPGSCRGETRRNDWRSGLLDWQVVYRNFDFKILQRSRDQRSRLGYQKAVEKYKDNLKDCRQLHQDT